MKFEKLPLEKGHKMHKYKVINKKFDEEIGIIHWRGGWRQYVFQSYPEVDMSVSCNNEVNRFIKELMQDWKVNHG